jgi:PAS domain S-box-containing protein
MDRSQLIPPESEYNSSDGEQRYQRLLESVIDYIYRVEVINGRPTATWHSPGCISVTGYRPEEYEADPHLWYRMIYPPDRDAVTAQVAQLLAGETVTPLDHRLVHKDGSIHWVKNTPAPHYDDQGQLVAYDGAIIDITERKALEEVWRRYEFIVNTSKDFMTLIDHEHVYVAVNEAYCQALGRSRAEIVGRSVAEAWGKERYLNQIKPALDKCLSGKEVHYQGWFDVADQGRRCFDVVYFPYADDNKNFTHAVVVSRDITKLKWAEEEVQRRNRELVLLNQVIATSVVGLEPELILDTVCRELAQTFDVPHAAAMLFNEDKTAGLVVAEYRVGDRPMALGQTIPVADNPVFHHLLTQQTPLVVNDAPNDLRMPHSALRQQQIVSFMLLPLIVDNQVLGGLGLADGQPHTFSTGDVNLAWSVADQVAGSLARTRLIQEHRRLSTAIEQTADSVIITDLDGKIVYVNPAFEQASGYKRAEVMGQNPRIFQSGKHNPAFYQKLWQTISSGQVWKGRFVNKKKDGAFYTLEATLTPVRNDGGTIVNYLALERDVTRVLQLEEQLRQAQKMEAIGRLAGGVAHDFNNILTIINGHSELLLQRHLEPEGPMRWEIEQIHEAGERAAVLTHQLLAFSRRQSIQPQVLNLNDVIVGLQKMLRRLIDMDIELNFKLAPDLGLIKADRNQLDQVLMNLVVNARDAMPDGGQLTLDTANIDLDETYAEQHLELTPGAYVLLTVSDTGLGFDAETQGHIFEPFFTTKEPGKGTGLGLSTVYGIIRQSKGHIWVYSEVGRGTTFKIYLPRVTSAAAEVIVPPPLPTGSLEGTETILLVEDEESVRVVARKFLQKKGYKVLEAGHPKEALQLCQKHPGQIDLLITDVIMPDMNGRELAERLGRTFTQLKVLYISGYANDALNQHGLLGAEIAFLEKPFSSDALARKVRAILDIT